MIVNRSTLADILGRTEATLATWLDEGMPRISGGVKGKSSEYDTAEVIRWLVARESGGNAVGDDGQVINFEAERARLTKEQADKAAMANDLARGRLVDADRVAGLWANTLTNCKTRLLSIPTKAAPLVLGCKTMPQARDIIERFVVEALNDLVSADPTTDRSGAEGVDAAAEADGEPVGGPAPKVKPRKQRRARTVDH